jgi:3-deoxy-D-manno-octulosonic acid (KDO) 8-phosphate synthase
MIKLFKVSNHGNGESPSNEGQSLGGIETQFIHDLFQDRIDVGVIGVFVDVVTDPSWGNSQPQQIPTQTLFYILTSEVELWCPFLFDEFTVVIDQ